MATRAVGGGYPRPGCIGAASPPRSLSFGAGAGRASAPPPPAPHGVVRPQRRGCSNRGGVAVAATSSPAGELKEEIVRLVANTKRGKATTSDQRASILERIEALEGLNPTPNPTRTGLVSGQWSLLYQAPLTEEAAQDKAATLEGPFLAAFQPLTQGLVRTKRNLQVIDLDGGAVENLAEFVAFGVDGSLNILGTADARDDGVKVDVEFTAFDFKLGALKFRVPLSWVKARGWIETTYVDEEIRVGRGDKGSVFVTARAK